MERVLYVRPIPTVTTDNSDRGLETSSSAIDQGRHRKGVVPVNGEEFGDIGHLQLGAPRAVGVLPATQYDPSLIEAFFGMSAPDPAAQDERFSSPLPFGVPARGEQAATISTRS